MTLLVKRGKARRYVTPRLTRSKQKKKKKKRNEQILISLERVNNKKYLETVENVTLGE